MNYPGDYDVVNPLWQRGMAYGVQQERARIIALMENDRENCGVTGDCDACGHLTRIMSAIKGENE